MSGPTPNGGVWSKSKITKNVPTQLPQPVVYTLMYRKMLSVEVAPDSRV